MTGQRFGTVELVAPPIRGQVCRLCGVQRGRGEPDDGWIVDVVPTLERRDVRIERDADGIEHATAPEPAWSRRHVECHPTVGYLIEAAAGVSIDGLTVDDVNRVHATAGVDLTAEAANYRGRRPFGWVTDADRSRLTIEIESARWKYQPKPDPNRRRCGLCGIGRSGEWKRLTGWAWQDRMAASACVSCSAMLATVRDPDQHPERVRCAALAAAANMSASPMLLPVAVRWKACCEVAASTEYSADDAAAWTYRREAVGRLAREAQERLPGLVHDPRRRALAEARLAERYREAEQADAEQRALDEPEAALW